MEKFKEWIKDAKIIKAELCSLSAYLPFSLIGISESIQYLNAKKSEILKENKESESIENILNYFIK